jgi:hypothetical protein
VEGRSPTGKNVLKKNIHTHTHTHTQATKQLSTQMAIRQNQIRRQTVSYTKLRHIFLLQTSIDRSIDRKVRYYKSTNQCAVYIKQQSHVTRCRNTPQFIDPRRTMMVHRQADNIVLGRYNVSVTQLFHFWLHCIAY